MSDFVPKWCNSNSQRLLYPSNFASPPPFPPPFTPPPFAFQGHPQLHYHAASLPVTGQVPLLPSAFPSSNTEIVQPLPLHIDTAQDKVKLWMKTCKLSWPDVSHVKPPNCTDNLTLHTIKIILHKLNLHKLKFKASSSNKATITEPSDPEVSTSETSETHPSAMHTCLSSVDHSSSYRMEEIEKEMQSLLEVLEDRRTQEVVKSKIAAAQKRKASRLTTIMLIPLVVNVPCCYETRSAPSCSQMSPRLRRLNTQQRLWEQRRLEEEHKANQHKEIETWFDGLQETKRVWSQRFLLLDILKFCMVS
ncbi:uncharacterized protein [Watersipora subatra]|uniref:uncharacterized protein n=1 Tax=Watersipora subatra TaxID=2589382 RepID=UPI00355B7510